MSTSPLGAPLETATIPASRRRFLSPAAAVWLVWAVAFASILISIARDGRNVPFEEDWLMVGPMTGHESDLPRWLWSQNSEHRLPLPRLVNLALLRATDDFRSTMVFDAAAIAAVAAAMILVARRLRGGRSSLADAFFPLLLLHLGNWDNLVWGWQIQFVLPTVLACALLLVIVARRGPPVGWGAAAGAVAVIGLPLSGANGLIFAPTLAAWLAYAVWTRRREPGAGAGDWLAAGAACLAVVLCALYFVGYEASPWNQASPGPGATLATVGKFLALSLGPVAAKGWLLCGAAAVVVYLIALRLLSVAYRRDPEERLRILGLLAFLAAALLLAVAVGWGRAGRAAATGRMPTRYVLLAAPGLCAAYFAALLFGRGWLGRALPVALATGMALLFPLNTWMGFERRAWFGAGFAAFEHDLAAGASKEMLADRHHEFMLHWDVPLMTASLQQLHDAGIGPFAAWEPEPTAPTNSAPPAAPADSVPRP
jgi:hypothetical protein